MTDSKGKIPTLKPETITLKNLFTVYAADIEKVANEMVQPHAFGQICVPPEVILILFWGTKLFSIFLPSLCLCGLAFLLQGTEQ